MNWSTKQELKEFVSNSLKIIGKTFLFLFVMYLFICFMEGINSWSNQTEYPEDSYYQKDN